MKIKYGNVSDDMFFKYLDRLTNECYKVLCMYEDQSETLYKYIQSLIFDLSGATSIIECFGDNPHFLVLLSTLESISDEVLVGDFNNKEFIKGEIFKCMSIINKIKQTTVESGDINE